MAWFKVISSVPVSVDFQNGSCVSYPRNAVFEADPNLRDIQIALRGGRRLVALGEVLPPSMRATAIPAPGPRSKPPAAHTEKKTQPMPTVSYRGKTYTVDHISSR